MKEQKINTKEKEFLTKVDEFFNARSVTDHLRFVDHWMEILLGGKLNKRWGEAGQLYDFYGLIAALFESANDLINKSEILNIIEHNSKVNLAFLANEKQILEYFPYQLKQKELLNPTHLIVNIFKEKNLRYYLQTLNKWVAAGLNNNYTAENADFIIPLYGSIKKLISTCWLIHERIVSKNSYQAPIYPNPLLNYALTEPSLFTPEEANEPFLVIEFFFNFTNLSGYREELQKYYIVAVNEGLTHENPGTLFFIHNQYISLIQAGYLIVSNNLSYVAKANRYGSKTLGEWLLRVRDKQVKEGEIHLSDETAHVLSMQERADPMGYCKKTLTHENVIKLRFGLKECLDAGLSNRSSIADFEEGYVFELYLTLQKLTEAFYLIITANAEEHVLPLKNTSHEG